MEEPMRAVIFGVGLALAMATSSLAQTADKKTTPGDAPTKSMHAATPEMEGPRTGGHTPTRRMDEAVPPMKAGDTAGGAVGMSKADCEAVWKQANPNNAPTLPLTQAQPDVGAFKT